MNNKIIIILGLVLFSLASFAAGDDSGTNGFSSLKIIYSARANAMAGAYSSLDDDLDVIYFNPASLASYGLEQEVATTYMNYFDGYNGGSVTYQRKYSDNSHFGVFSQFLTSGDIPKTVVGDNGGYLEIGSFTNSDFIVGGNFSYYLNDQLNIGINTKFIQENIDNKDASAIVFDLGILHRPINNKIRIGAVIRNIGKQLSYFTKAENDEGIPTVFAGGISYRTNITQASPEDAFTPAMIISLDLSLAQGEDLIGLIGTEFQLHEQFLFRFGYKTNSGDYRNGGDQEMFSGLSTGVGFIKNNLKIDYSLNSYGDLGFVNQITLKYQF